MDQVNLRLKLLKIMLVIAVIWSAGFLLLAGLALIDRELLDFAVNLSELVFGLASGTLLLTAAKFSSNRLVITGTALAVYSWTLGQIYWFSFMSITGDLLPYPSVGELGYTGAYFLLMGVIGLINRLYPATFKKAYRFAALLVLAVPVILLFIGKTGTDALIYNFILSSAVTVTVFKAFSLSKTIGYHLFTAGIFLFAAADILFMFSASLFPKGYTFISEAFYICSIALISYGILKGGRSSS